MFQRIDSIVTPAQREVLISLDSPYRIQEFLDSVQYSEDDYYRSPVQVLVERKAHCFDGALLAAMALRRLGYPPLILELIPNGRDDDHLVALFRIQKHWGGVAQSNFSGLRYREAVYRNIRELVMSYFDMYFNARGEKTLLGYRGPINLKVFDHLEWMSRDDRLEALADGMDRYCIRRVIDDEMAARLSPVDARSLRAGLLGANQAGLYKVG
jgi:hypothetical protein